MAGRPRVLGLPAQQSGIACHAGEDRRDTRGDAYHPRVDASEFRDHWADTEAEWSHGGAWLTSFVLPPKVVVDPVGSAVGHIDLPFLVPVPAAAMHISLASSTCWAMHPSCSTGPSSPQPTWKAIGESDRL